MSKRLRTWFRGDRAEVDHFTSDAAQIGPEAMGGSCRPVVALRESQGRLSSHFYLPKKARWSCLYCEEESRGFASISMASSATFLCSDGSAGGLRSQLRRARTFAWILVFSRVTSSAIRCKSSTCSRSD